MNVPSQVLQGLFSKGFLELRGHVQGSLQQKPDSSGFTL